MTDEDIIRRDEPLTRSERWEPRLDRDWRTFLEVVSWTTWVAFAVDFAGHLHLAEHRVRYAFRHWYDVVLTALPMFRPLRLLRLLALVRILDRSASSTLAGRAVVYVAAVATAAVGIGALAVLDAERGAEGATITTFGDALWWACTTVTTVGYGDYYPVTGEGRTIAVGLMVVGIGVVGSVTAAVATGMLGRVQHQRPSAPTPGSHGEGR